MGWLSEFTMSGVSFLSSIFVFAVGLGALGIVILFFIDITQTKDAVRHNYPVVGRFRYIFTKLGEFFRQYFFAMDREEMPFNRAERDWIADATTGKSKNQPFGSTRNVYTVGTPIFVNAAFALLDEETKKTTPVVFGPNTKHPYAADQIINVSAMSYGALSKPAVQALSHGAAKAGCYINTGEGGISPFHLEGGGDVVFQLGTAKYGARDKQGNFSSEVFLKNANHPQVKMIELKLAQGAKPGKGGILPAAKVNREIAKIRNIKPNTPSISPNRHPEIGDFDELLTFVGNLRDLSGKPVGIKTVIGDESWAYGLCEAIKRNGEASAPDFITIDGGDGGTGAAPIALLDNVGMTLRESLPLLINVLIEYDLRERVKVIASGKLVTPAEVAWAYAMGADMVNSARGFMFAIGCIQAMRCNTNECPTGVTTHDKRLQAGLNPKRKSVRVEHFVNKMSKDVEVIAHSCGAAHTRELRRNNVRMMGSEGRSTCCSVLYPEPQAE